MKKLLTLALLAIFPACTSVHVVGFRDPGLLDRAYASFVIHYDDAVDLNARKEIEDTIVWKFERRGVKAVSHLALFPPVREYTQKEITDALRAANIQGVLRLRRSLKDRNTLASTTPGDTGTRLEAFIILETEVTDAKDNKRVFVGSIKSGMDLMPSTLLFISDKLYSTLKEHKIIQSK